jgi:hypothetical protein
LLRGRRVVENGDMKTLPEQIHVGHVRACVQGFPGGETLVGEDLEDRAPKGPAEISGLPDAISLPWFRIDAGTALSLIHRESRR